MLNLLEIEFIFFIFCLVVPFLPFLLTTVQSICYSSCSWHLPICYSNCSKKEIRGIYSCVFIIKVGVEWLRNADAISIPVTVIQLFEAGRTYGLTVTVNG
jgi:hypothetical protein